MVSEPGRVGVVFLDAQVGRKTAFDAAAELIGSKLEAARARKQSESGPIKPEVTETEPASDRVSLSDLLKEAAQ